MSVIFRSTKESEVFILQTQRANALHISTSPLRYFHCRLQLLFQWIFQTEATCEFFTRAILFHNRKWAMHIQLGEHLSAEATLTCHKAVLAEPPPPKSVGEPISVLELLIEDQLTLIDSLHLLTRNMCIRMVQSNFLQTQPFVHSGWPEVDIAAKLHLGNKFEVCNMHKIETSSDRKGWSSTPLND